VPQHRKRVIAIGALGWDPTFPEPTHNAYGAPGAQVASRSGLPRTPTLEEALAHLPAAAITSLDGQTDHAYIPLGDVDLRRAELLGPGQTMRDLPQELWHESYRKRAFRRVMDGTPSERRGGAPSGLRRLKGDEPSKAITGGALRDFLHPAAHRPLTVRECATLQTFPQDFRFFGRQSDRIQLIGNAVPARLGEVIGRSIRRDVLSAPTDAALPGALLSFVPTLADGMSPALLTVTQRIMTDFGSSALEGYSADLWR
jgi:DNA (cytosine-5)-methyltransferase 1